ncbi:LuxR C-terminal-related transcriptional regulator [Williamsia sp. DF01-3]|uniref:LuxR C-terminal-related transcriptional regulator n=1 Tax=Williamsia sp. DF01-3 TaxID=2934157 RepID=UPI001FF13173|nr:LuxR C-terminal-related transcriptional regulator [Williamsia sp. DF01-3]MCK0520304.1 LuxR family transcriptional regulator [Williamsia sp. DF01-3]
MESAGDVAVGRSPVNRLPGATAFTGMPAAQALLSAVHAGGPVLAFVTGVAGSGKSDLLQQCRRLLNRSGTQVFTTLPEDEATPPGCAVIVDDVHHWETGTLSRLTDLADRGDLTVIAAAEPRLSDNNIRQVQRTFSALGTDIKLGPLPTPAIIARSGGTVSAPVADVIRRTAGGNRAAIDTALDVLRADPAGDERVAREAIAKWQHERLRALDPTTHDVLTVAALQPSPDPHTIADTLGLDPTAAIEALDRARGSGFLTGTDEFLPAALPVLRAVRGEHQIASTHRSLVDALLDRGALTVDGALSAARSGVVDGRLADLLLSAARTAPPAQAADLWHAALTAGADPGVVRVPLADAATLAGDLDTATRLADTILAADSPSDRRDAVRIGAAVAARRGTYSRSADLYRWLGPEAAGPDATIGVLTLLAIGDRPGAEEFSATADAAPPTTDHARGTLLSSGLLASLTSSPAAALGPILRAVSLSAQHRRAEPESAAAVAALLCLHSGDLAGAKAALSRDCDQTPREQLLLGWTAMVGGDLTTAADILGEVTPQNLRDELVAHALAVAIARRRGDMGALVAAWRDAVPAVAEMEVDLFALHPLGELWLAAVRLQDTARLAHLVTAADRLLAALGSPPAWSMSWSWYGVQAAILADDPSALVPYARQLGQAAAGEPFGAALADAGRAWLRVLQGQPDVAEVKKAASALEQAGLPWDAARLAGEAALRVDDTQAATSLLQVARLVGAPAVAATATHVDAAHPAAGPLTEREAEVARNLLLGLTYREIGARLFISGKTVEHHVARIRRRLGAGSRSEMLSMLRAAGYGPATNQGGGQSATSS